MSLPIADRWFEFERISDDITRIWEPHTIRLMQCNIWHVRGRDLLVDTGYGVASLHEAARHTFNKSLSAVATHAHVGSRRVAARVLRTHHPSRRGARARCALRALQPPSRGSSARCDRHVRARGIRG